MSIDFRSLGFFVGSLAPILLVVLFDDAILSVAGPIVWLLLLVAAVVCFFVCSGRYIRRLDEAAWQAQKHAWFWGGGIGLALGLLAMFPMTVLVLRLFPSAPADVTPGQAFFAGALYLMICQAVGFTLHWIVWWARRT